MRFLCSEKLSQHKYKTSEGYLICVDAILARTGKQTYRKNEVFTDSDDDTEIEIDRTSEEVFAPQTLASFENKPITVEHPDEDVNAENHNRLSVGFVRDVHKGTANGQEVMLGTLVITDAQTIEEIENGEHTDLSCGYDCDIIDEANPQQRNIRGNHVALCQQGRAGIARIVDSVKDNTKDSCSQLVGDSIESDFEDITNMSDAKIVLQKYGIELIKKDNKNYILRKNGKDYTFYVLDNPNEVRKDLARAVHKLTDSIKDISSFTYYKGFVFEDGDMSAPTFNGFDRDMVVQKIRGFSLWIVYKRNGSHGDMYDLIGHKHEGFTVIIEPDKITIDKLHKYSLVNPMLVKAAKELEPTNNVVFKDSIDDDSNTDIEKVINVAKSRAFELTRQSKNYLTFRYKGSNRNKDVSEIAKILPNNMSASWDEDSLEIAIRDSIQDDIESIPTKARIEMNKSTNKAATIVGILNELQQEVDKASEMDKQSIKAKAEKILNDLKRQFNLEDRTELKIDSTKDSLSTTDKQIIDDVIDTVRVKTISNIIDALNEQFAGFVGNNYNDVVDYIKSKNIKDSAVKKYTIETTDSNGITNIQIVRGESLAQAIKNSKKRR